MELFSELYGCYYTVVAHILRQAKNQKGLTRRQIEALVRESAFGESCIHLLPRLLDGEWDLLEQRQGLYYSKLENAPAPLPLTGLQKAWLKALLLDRRIGLFLSDARQQQWNTLLAGVEPLFRPEQFHTFDSALDSDAFADPGYRARFRLLLDAVKEEKAVLVEYQKGKGGRMTFCFQPFRLSYSSRDDKFRVMGLPAQGKSRKPTLLNLSRIVRVCPREPQPDLIKDPAAYWSAHSPRKQVTLAIGPERNGVERCMLQFAAYDKETVFVPEEGRYLCTITYNAIEETELLIRILSFGPVVEVTAPAAFRLMILQRLQMQHHWDTTECANNPEVQYQ